MPLLKEVGLMKDNIGLPGSGDIQQIIILEDEFPLIEVNM